MCEGFIWLAIAVTSGFAISCIVNPIKTLMEELDDTLMDSMPAYRRKLDTISSITCFVSFIAYEIFKVKVPYYKKSTKPIRGCVRTRQGLPTTTLIL